MSNTPTPTKIGCFSITQQAKRMAKDFRASRGQAWSWVTNHSDLIDAEVMDVVRTVVWTGGSINGTQIMDLRAAFVTALEAEGFGVA